MAKHQDFGDGVPRGVSQGLLARLRTGMDNLIPLGYENETGFHYGSEPPPPPLDQPRKTRMKAPRAYVRPLVLLGMVASALLTLSGCATDNTPHDSTINSTHPVTVSNPFMTYPADGQTP